MKRLLPLPLLLCSGCAELREFGESLQDYLPKVTFQEFDVHDIDFQHVDVDFVFAVDNPNPIRVNLSSFSYDFGLADVDLLNGSNEEGFELAASDASELKLPLNMAWLDAWNTVQAVRGQDQIGFGLGGHFGFNTPLGEARVRYNEDGQFPALRTPKFRFDKVRVQRVNLSNPLAPTAEIRVDLGIDNEHGSKLFFDAFQYDLSLAGNQVGGGAINTFEVEGATEGNLELPLDINLLNTGVTLIDTLVGGGKLNIGMNARVDVDTPFGVIPLTIDETGNVDVLAPD